MKHKIINGFSHKYIIYEDGTVFSPNYIDKNGFNRIGRKIKPTVSKKGYLRVALIMVNGEKRYYSVHRLVASYFIENPLQKPEVNHIDGNKKNNNINNLEWVTSSQNIKHSYDTGLRSGTCHIGEKNNMAKLTEEKVSDILMSKLTVNELSNKYGISKSTIYKIKQGKRWNSLYRKLKTAGYLPVVEQENAA